MPDLVTFAAVEGAAGRISGQAHKTPVLTSRCLDDRLGCSAFIKAENFQRTGSFKFRGAYNAVSLVPEDARRKGVMTYSSGNHGQALALAGSLLGAPVTVVMPADAPAVKRAATEAYGAEVVLYDRSETVREELGRRLAEERGLTLVPPFDSPDIIAGQGTAAKELLEGQEVDILFVPAGGGGLASGTCVSAHRLAPGCKVVLVEPESGDDIARSFRSGKLVRIDTPDTIADGARTNSASELTLAHILEYAHDVVTVPDRALLEVTRFLAERMKVLVEPTGALSVAAAWTGAVNVSGLRAGFIVSGGNADIGQLCKLWSGL